MEKQVVVLGLGKTGCSACEFLQEEQIPFLATDDRIQDQSALVFDLLEKSRVSSIITSPGIPHSHPLIKRAQEKQVEVFCDIEYAFRMRKKNMVAITGTNGKTTTTLLTTHMMNYAKIAAKSVGNIGIPIFSSVRSDAFLVVEISSFQLQTIKTKALDVAACLNISPNHLDHHATLDEYVQTKRSLESLVLESGVFFVGKKAYETYFPPATNAQIVGGDPSCDVYSDGRFLWRHGCKEIEVPKKLYRMSTHDLENFTAAYAICRHLGISPELCVASYDTFKKPPHRIEFVINRDGVLVYDDSKATSIDAVLRAVESLEKNIVLIAGGVHKGFPYTLWKEGFRGRVKKAFLNGPAARFIQKDIEGAIDTVLCASFEEAVSQALIYAVPGDRLLLSPGCSSYDRFTNYEERGKLFQQLVTQILS